MYLVLRRCYETDATLGVLPWINLILSDLNKSYLIYSYLNRRCYGSHAKAERAKEKGDQKQGGFDHHDDHDHDHDDHYDPDDHDHNDHHDDYDYHDHGDNTKKIRRKVDTMMVIKMMMMERKRYGYNNHHHHHQHNHHHGEQKFNG